MKRASAILEICRGGVLLKITDHSATRGAGTPDLVVSQINKTITRLFLLEVSGLLQAP